MDRCKLSYLANDRKLDCIVHSRSDDVKGWQSGLLVGWLERLRLRLSRYATGGVIYDHDNPLTL